MHGVQNVGVTTIGFERSAGAPGKLHVGALIHEPYTVRKVEYHHKEFIAWGSRSPSLKTFDNGQVVPPPPRINAPIRLTLLSSGISRSSRHKRSATGAQRAHYRKKRKFELGRQPASTKLGVKRVHTVRVRGGNLKYRALRLDSGNFAWGSESVTKKTRLIGVVYNASNNELVRTNTLVKGAIIQIDATPFRQWYETHYAQPITKKGKAQPAAAATTEGEEPKKLSHHAQRNLDEKKKDAKIDPLLESQFAAGRLYASISSRPGQSGRADGYILEGKELEFYLRKLRSGKQKHAHA